MLAAEVEKGSPLPTFAFAAATAGRLMLNALTMLLPGTAGSEEDDPPPTFAFGAATEGGLAPDGLTKLMPGTPVEKVDPPLT